MILPTDQAAGTDASKWDRARSDLSSIMATTRARGRGWFRMAPTVAAALLVVVGCTYSERGARSAGPRYTPADRRAIEQ